MKKFKKMIAIFSMIGIASFTPILPISTPKTAQAAALAINEVDLTLENGHYRTLKVYYATGKVTWVSTNSKVATVSSNGRVTAKASGTTTIIARSGNQKISTRVRVIQINKKNLTLAKDQSSSLVVWGANDTLTFKSSNPKVASVSKNGKVTGKSKGKAVITATVNGKELKTNVTVVGLSTDSMVLEYGGVVGFIDQVTVDGYKGPVTWTSKDKSIASVDKDGYVTAEGAGSTTITANVNGAKLNTTVKVLEMSPVRFTLFEGETKKVNVLGTDSKIQWSSYKPSVATVDKNGVITARKEGKAKIVAEVDGRRVRAYVTVIKN